MLLWTSGSLYEAIYFIDIPSIIIILIVLVPGMFILDCQKNFIKSFSVGTKKYSLLELKDIKLAVIACQKLVIFASTFASVFSFIILLQNYFDSKETFGPNLAVVCLSIFYGAFLEYLLFPLRLNTERAINKEMDLGENE